MATMRNFEIIFDTGNVSNTLIGREGNYGDDNDDIRMTTAVNIFMSRVRCTNFGGKCL
jgi:hypothetical protein